MKKTEDCFLKVKNDYLRFLSKEKIFDQSKTAKHYFCSNCGIYTHHNPRSNPAMYGINVACLEGVKPFELKDVGVNDGENHPLDKK